MKKIAYKYRSYGSYGSSQCNICPLMCIGIMLTIMGIVGTLISVLGGFTEHFGIAPAIGPIAMICVGAVLIPIGIYYTIKIQKQADDAFTEYQPSRSRTHRYRSRAKSSIRNCPACKAPLPKRPPCKCEYCGTQVD